MWTCVGSRPRTSTPVRDVGVGAGVMASASAAEYTLRSSGRIRDESLAADPCTTRQWMQDDRARRPA